MKKMLQKFRRRWMATHPEDRNQTEVLSRRQVNRRTFLAFTGFIGFNAIVYGVWRLLYKSPNEIPGITADAKKPFRKALETNEEIFRRSFSSKHLVKTYPKSMAAKQVRVNSDIGMEDDDFDPATWQLTVNRKNGGQLKLKLEDLKTLPHNEIVFDFKCVEGWDQISWWGGVRFSDFIEHFNLQDDAAANYVGFATPDGAYYVGVEREAAMHPQTLLAYEVNGQALPLAHGQPLRLIIPVKYGIKNIKRIGSISFLNQRPKDYWAEQGYDYYSGL